MPELQTYIKILQKYEREKVNPYQDASVPVDVRVEDLLRRMTLREKTGQMTQLRARIDRIAQK